MRQKEETLETYLGLAILTHLTLTSDGHLVHARRDGLHRRATSGVDLAQRDAAVLVFGRHLLPFLHLRHAGTPHSFKRIGDRLTCLHIAKFEEGNGDETRATQATDRFGDKPFLVRLGDNNNGLASFGV